MSPKTTRPTTASWRRKTPEGFYGVGLRTWLIDVGGDAVRKNMTTLGSKVLPVYEFEAYNMICTKFLKMNLKPYIPNFRLAFQHFCIHPEVQSVINGIGKILQLTDYDLDPSRMALYRFHQHEEAYMEAKRRFRAGVLVWHIALDSSVTVQSGKF